MMYSFVIVLAALVGGIWCDGQQSCDTNRMMNCLLSLGESAERDRLFFPDTPEKLQNYCKHLMKGLECANKIIDECATEQEKEIYRNLTVDMVGMNVALCTDNSPLSRRFLQHVNCYKQLSDRFKKCSDTYIGNIVVVHGLSQEEQVKMTCCTVFEYSRCMKNVVTGRCDKEAADLVEETVVRTLSTPMVYCKQMDGVQTGACRKKFTPHSSQSSGNDNDDEYDAEKDKSTTARISYTCLIVVLLRLMLYR